MDPGWRPFKFCAAPEPLEMQTPSRGGGPAGVSGWAHVTIAATLGESLPCWVSVAQQHFKQRCDMIANSQKKRASALGRQIPTGAYLEAPLGDCLGQPFAGRLLRPIRAPRHSWEQGCSGEGPLASPSL